MNRSDYWAQAASLRQRSPHPRSPSPKERGQCAVVLRGGCKENFELSTSCKLAPAGAISDKELGEQLASTKKEWKKCPKKQ